ncbi:MAG: glucokinase [Chloroflexi bacterium]|nr:glucokinase [Chloroflexota bacterium]
MLLVGDIGGTKTSLAVYSRPDRGDYPIGEATLKSAAFSDPGALVQVFLNQSGLRVDSAVFGIAGPVVHDAVRTTNLPWTIRAQDLRETLGLSNLWLLNDLQAVANSIPTLGSGDLEILQEGEFVKHSAIAVIAPGTGLGEAYLTDGADGYRAHASEGGHADFAPLNALQIDLLNFLLEEYDHVSYERLCSGMGLPNIYRFLKKAKGLREPDWLANQLKESSDPTPVIVRGAAQTEKPSAICVETVRLFCEILGAECSNVALKFLATGGIYLAGGMLLKMLDVFDKAVFLEAFRAKGRFADLMSSIPVSIIVNPNAALIGASRFAFQQLEMQKRSASN